jgi:hypothetical protein
MKFCCSSGNIFAVALIFAIKTAGGFVPLSGFPQSSKSRSSSLKIVPGGYDPMGAIPLPPPSQADPVDITLANMFPTDIPMRKMQGGGTVRTWDIPPEAERLYYYIRTNGRPLKAMVELVSKHDDDDDDGERMSCSRVASNLNCLAHCFLSESTVGRTYSSHSLGRNRKRRRSPKLLQSHAQIQARNQVTQDFNHRKPRIPTRVWCRSTQHATDEGIMGGDAESL